MLKLIKHLGDGDVLHFITYDTQPTVVFRDGDLSETGKEALRASVQKSKHQKKREIQKHLGGKANRGNVASVVPSLKFINFY